jgi:hypothetical protein
MNKIKTLFKRGDNFGVIDEVEVDLEGCYATEKIDGTNIRLTIRKHQVVRIEARKNPTKQQKKDGIIDAWYRDADPVSDKWIINAVETRTYNYIEDGEYSAEAYGDKIQGDVLNMGYGDVFIFSNEQELQKAIFTNCPTTYKELKEWLPKQNSKLGNAKIEGIVFYNQRWNIPVAKIKVKDFR